MIFFKKVLYILQEKSKSKLDKYSHIYGSISTQICIHNSKGFLWVIKLWLILIVSFAIFAFSEFSVMNLSCCQNQGTMLITFCKWNIHILMCCASVSPGITFLRNLLHTERELRFYLLSEVKLTHFGFYICIRLAWVPAEINGWFFICGFPGLPHFRSKELYEASFHFMPLFH